MAIRSQSTRLDISASHADYASPDHHPPPLPAPPASAGSASDRRLPRSRSSWLGGAEPDLDRQATLAIRAGRALSRRALRRNRDHMATGVRDKITLACTECKR